MCSVPGTVKRKDKNCVPGTGHVEQELCVPGTKFVNQQLPCGINLRYSDINPCSDSEAIQTAVDRTNSICKCAPQLLKGVDCDLVCTSICSRSAAECIATAS